MFNFLSKFKKKDIYVCGLNFEEDFTFQLLELKKINKSYAPVFFKNIFLEDIFSKELFKKEKFIKYFKNYKKEIKSDAIKVYINKSEKLKKEIESSLKIVGFKKIIFIDKKNVLGIILNNFTPYERNVFYFTQKRIYFFNVKDKDINFLDELSSKNFSSLKIEEFLQKSKTSTVYITGNVQNKLDSIKKTLKISNYKMELLNIWNNFLNFKDDIPAINLIDSYDYIDVLSFTVPSLNKRPYLGEKIIEEKESTLLLSRGRVKVKITEIEEAEIKEKKEIKKNKKKKEVKKVAPNVLFLPKHNSNFVKKIRNLFLKRKKKVVVVEKKEEKEKNNNVQKNKKEIKKDKKNIKKGKKKGKKSVFLPKKVKKLFLPKFLPKKNGVWKKIQKFFKFKI